MSVDHANEPLDWGAYIIELYDNDRYLVSRKKPPQTDYLVDMAYEGGNPRCSCFHYDFLPKGSTKKCRHVRLVEQMLREDRQPDGEIEQPENI